MNGSPTAPLHVTQNFALRLDAVTLRVGATHTSVELATSPYSRPSNSGNKSNSVAQATPSASRHMTKANVTLVRAYLHSIATSFLSSVRLRSRASD